LNQQSQAYHNLKVRLPKAKSTIDQWQYLPIGEELELNFQKNPNKFA
jgi:hypothetical protein